MMLLTVVGMGSARAQTVIYSWDDGDESGGKATSTNAANIAFNSSGTYGYTTLRLNGRSDYSTDYVTITLDKALAGGEKISVTAFRSRNDVDYLSGFKAKFDKGGEVKSSTGLEFVNLDQSDASAGDSNRGTEPNTCEFTVPAEAAGSTVITMTRSHTKTNLYIDKLVITTSEGDEPVEPVVTIAKPTFEVNGVKYESGATVEGLKTGQQVIINVEDGMYIYTNWSSKTGGKKETYYIVDRMKGQNTFPASTSSGGQRVLYAVAGDKDDATGNSSDLAYIIFPGVVASEPVFSPAAGEVEAGTVVTLTKGCKDDKVFYTTDGSDPTAESTAYTDEGIKVEEGVTIKAIAFDKNTENGSAIVSATYTIPAPAVVIPTPTFTPESGSTITFGGEVTISYDQAYTLYYTTDGSDPKTSDTVQPGFNNPETIIAEKEGTLTIKAFLSNKDGESEVVTATYTVEGKPIVVGAPTFDPAPGAVEKGTQVHIIFGENATSVSFTTDGSDPLLGDVYTSSKQIDALAPIIINEETTIKAICRTNEGGKTYSSEVVTVKYTVKEPEVQPDFALTFDPKDGTKVEVDNEITLTYDEEAFLLYYTTDGSDPKAPTSNVISAWGNEEKVTVKGEGNFVIKAYLENRKTNEQSEVFTATYPIKAVAPFAINFDPESGAEVEVDDIITMSFDGDAFNCSYTTDGSDPRTSMTMMTAMPEEFIVVKGEGEFVITAVLENRKTNEVSELFTATYPIKATEPVVADVTIETKANGYGTFCYDKDLDFSASDAKAYIGRLDGNKIYLTEIQQVPAGTGILVQSGAADCTVPVMEGAIPINSKNDFIGVLEDTEVAYGTVSILSVVNGEEGFYKFLGTTIPAYRAYFPAVAAGSAQAKLSLIFEDADGIGQIVSNAIVDGNAYNLNGQRVKSNYKGVVIVNGKKYYKK